MDKARIHELNIFSICSNNKEIFKIAKMIGMEKYLTCSFSREEIIGISIFIIFQIRYMNIYT